MAGKPERGALDRERRRRQAAASSAPVASTRREAAATCGWCRGPIEVKGVGRIPKWCSPACRQRAWEQSRAAASGRSAVEVVERVVEVPVERARVPRHGEWPDLLRELAAQIEDGRVYPRDVRAIAPALADLIAAVNRHPAARLRRPETRRPSPRRS